MLTSILISVLLGVYWDNLNLILKELYGIYLVPSLSPLTTFNLTGKFGSGNNPQDKKIS